MWQATLSSCTRAAYVTCGCGTHALLPCHHCVFWRCRNGFSSKPSMGEGTDGYFPQQASSPAGVTMSLHQHDSGASNDPTRPSTSPTAHRPRPSAANQSASYIVCRCSRSPSISTAPQQTEAAAMLPPPPHPFRPFSHSRPSQPSSRSHPTVTAPYPPGSPPRGAPPTPFRRPPRPPLPPPPSLPARPAQALPTAPPPQRPPPRTPTTPGPTCKAPTASGSTTATQIVHPPATAATAWGPPAPAGAWGPWTPGPRRCWCWAMMTSSAGAGCLRRGPRAGGCLRCRGRRCPHPSPQGSPSRAAGAGGSWRLQGRSWLGTTTGWRAGGRAAAGWGTGWRGSSPCTGGPTRGTGTRDLRTAPRSRFQARGAVGKRWVD